MLRPGGPGMCNSLSANGNAASSGFISETQRRLTSAHVYLQALGAAYREDAWRTHATLGAAG
jgi:hypothetical protein